MLVTLLVEVELGWTRGAGRCGPHIWAVTTVAGGPGMKGLPPLPTGTSPKKNRDMPLNEGGWSREAMNTRPGRTESLCVG